MEGEVEAEVLGCGGPGGRAVWDMRCELEISFISEGDGRWHWPCIKDTLHD